MGELTEIIKAEIAAQGAIPFSRFMELALYCPEYGYYEQKSGTVGRSGDFYTSVSVGSLFGTLLAFQFARWLERLPGDPVYLVEAGAHDGKLAGDVLNWLVAHQPELMSRLTYVIIEPSARRRAWQAETLQRFDTSVAWVRDASELPNDLRGVIFSNELLDAFPVRRLGWNQQTQQWFEWGVVWSANAFHWTKLSGTVTLPEWFQVPPELQCVLPADHTLELNSAAEQWWRSAAQALRRGWLLTLDYGLDAEDFLSSHRPNGTVRAYHQHRAVPDVLGLPGAQDLTAHVNFSRLQREGEGLGLVTEFYGLQGRFLSNLAKQLMQDHRLATTWSARWSRELQTLIHPEHLGRSFRVLLQSRGITDTHGGHVG